MDKNSYIFQTNYFQREWTWIKRIFVMILLNIGILTLPLSGKLEFLKLFFIVLVTFYLIAKPKDDLAIDETQLFHIKKSVISKFTKIDKYKLSELTSIRAGGIHSDKWELVDFFNGEGNTGGYSNTLEMSFKDGSSNSLELAISRERLDKIVQLAYEFKNINL